MRHNPNSRKPEDAPDEPKQLTAALRALAAALAPLVAAELAKGSPPLGQFSAFDRHAPAEVAPPPAAQPIELSDDEQALEALGLRRAS